ncbi:NAD(P)-dependent malic enzyme [Ihubacter sp. rT4E-8]|uniref:NAD(P)-dependent malic enzyme n=1 Tax=Ihubacter sp. rT4E-8 TaxID=3242369 RepID=UPI003CF9E594
MDYEKESLKCHEEAKGKIKIAATVPIDTEEDLAIYYTPGVAAPCLAIADSAKNASKYTCKNRTVAIVTDGSAILGLGNIGSLAGLPVMEGKAALFKRFANVDAFPICLDTQDPDEIIKTVKHIAPGFGAINLEDIAAPACFKVERTLKKELSIPVFHDDQHGTAIVTCAALLNALKVTKKTIAESKVVINGAGAAGTAIAEMLSKLGCKNIILCDSKGIIAKHRKNLNAAKKELLTFTNPDNQEGSLIDALEKADVFIGVSTAGILSQKMIRSMGRQPIIFAMANPIPEILPNEAIAAGAAVVGTGRSDYVNQINNVLVFPALFKGALEAHAQKITDKMLLAAVYALAGVVTESELSPEYIIPTPFHPDVTPAIANAVRLAWTKE